MAPTLTIPWAATTAELRTAMGHWGTMVSAAAALSALVDVDDVEVVNTVALAAALADARA